MFQANVDEDGIFAEPVVEAFPEIARDYKKVVKNPMDFRTILEDRLPIYKSIRECQQDLILIIQNCMTFNVENSVYRNLAK